MAPCENVTTPSANKTFLLDNGKSNGETYFNFFGTSLEEGIAPSGGNCSLWNSSAKADVNCSLAVTLDEVPVKLNKFQIIKAVVLAGVTVVIMISICRMVFQLFVRYNVRHDR